MHPSNRWAGFLVLAAACGGAGPSAEVQRTDSAGVAIVTNHGEDSPLPWQFEEVLRLGGADEGPEAFARIFPSGIEVDGAGNIYVLDAGEVVLHVFDAKGGHVRSVGRRGGGPGELQFPSDLAVSEDGVAGIYDFGKQGIVRFGPGGEVLPEMPMRGDLQRGLVLSPLGVVGVFQERQSGDAPAIRRLLAIGAGDTLHIAEQTSTVMKMVEFPNCGIRVMMPPVFEPTVVWAARGEHIGVNTQPLYAVDVFERGRHVRSIRRALDPVAATIDLAARELGDTLRMIGGPLRCAIGPRDAAESRGFAAIVPPVRELALSPDGSWWVSRRTAAAEPYVVTDVFSPEGEYLGMLQPAAPWPAAFRGADEILTIERDELDLAYVVVYRLVRNAR